MATLGFNIIPSSYATNENGSTVTINVSLNTAPSTVSSFVVISFSSSDTTEGFINDANKATLTFNSTNWNVVQTITVTGVQDYLNPTFDFNTAYSIFVQVDTTLTRDINYSQLMIYPINLINNEDVTTATDAEPDDRFPVGTPRDLPVKIYGDVMIVDINSIETRPGLVGQYKTLGVQETNDIIVGLDGNDRLYGGYLQDELSGGLGNDELHGGDSEDFLYGQDGNDSLYGENGNDVLIGDNGNDTLFGGYGADVLNGGEGNDILYGGAADLAINTMDGGNGNDIYYVYADGGNDIIQDTGLATDIDTLMIPYDASSYTLPDSIEYGIISPGSKANSLTGNANNNVLTGNAGNNTLNGGVGNDILNGSFGVDTASYNTATDSIVVNLTNVDAQNTGISTGNDTLISIENVIGSNYNDIILGNKGVNILNGGKGDDTLNGNSGDDKLTGGAGKDTFIIDNLSKDTITDFIAINDTINLDNSVFTKLTTLAILATNYFRSGTAAVDNDDYIIYDKTTGIISYDADANASGASIQIAQVTTNLALTNANFNVIDASTNNTSIPIIDIPTSSDIAPTGTATATLTNGTEDTNYRIKADDLLQGFNDDDSSLSILDLKATHGKINTANSYVFKPTANYNGIVTLTYKVSDGVNAPLNATLNFNVNPVNDAPTGTATAILINGTEDTAYTLKTSDLIQGFNDIDGDNLTVTNLSVNHGTLNGLVFTPDSNYNGVVNLNYSVSDGTLSSSATQSFILNKVNDLPTGSLAIVGSSNNAAIVGQTLTAGLGTLADVDGLGTLTYNWSIAGTNVSSTNSYVSTSNDIGKTLMLTGRYTDMQGTIETINSSVIISKAPAVSLNALDGLMTAENNGIDNSISLPKAIRIAVALDTQPLRDVTVNFVSSDISEGIISNASLTFNATNWNIAQNLSISGVNDNENDGNIPYQITASISSDDVNYRQLAVNPINLINNADGIRDIAKTLIGDANGIPNTDVLIGMDGADGLYGLLLADDLSGGIGNDTIYGGYGDDFLYGGEGNDYLWGEQDADKLSGENGNDILDGGIGLDTLIGGAGNDTYYLSRYYH